VHYQRGFEARMEIPGQVWRRPAFSRWRLKLNRRTVLFAGLVLGAAMPRMRSLTLSAAAAGPSQGSGAASGNEIFHVAIFRFAKEHVEDAIVAFHALASASRKESGNLRYDIYRGIDDDQEFYVVEHWASPAALATHERTEPFINLGRGVLVKHATLHDTVTARPFDVG